MTPAPPLPQHIWDALPVEARTLMEALQAQVEALRAEVVTLKARLDSNSSNSSKPPSTDPLHVKRQPPRPASKRKRGGQPGHMRAIRPMVPIERLTRVVDCVPIACPCGVALAGTDPTPHPHQVAELPEVRPDVVEYRLHRLTCPACRKATRAQLPPGVPTGAFGPRLLATIALLTGRYRLSKRQVRGALADLLGLSISAGMVSKAERRADAATAEPVAEIARAIAAAPTLNVDETGWREAGSRAWLWTAVAEGMTLFRIDRSRGAEALRRLVGAEITPVITSDRFSTYKRAPSRQVCWAHLRRDFQAMIDRAAGGQEVGAKLLALSSRVFDAWRRLGSGSIRRTTLRSYVGWLRPVVRLNLEAGRDGPCRWTAKVCRQLLAIEGSLWTFARVEGVAPDNNAAERALRHGVIWRRTSGGTDGERGSRFVGQILTVVATCRQQGRDLLGYLTECLRSHLGGSPAPSLLAIS
jgi:transposase